MSDTLRITLEGLQLDAQGEADLADIYRFAIAAEPSAIISSIRLVFRNEANGTTIEPFAGSASLEALHRLKRKRAHVSVLLAKLVACGFLFCENVGILLVTEGAVRPSDRTDLTLESLCKKERLHHAWYRIRATLTWFHLPQIEAKLFAPLKLTSDEIATHFFREFWVRAAEKDVAIAVASHIVRKDDARIVSFGKVGLDAPSTARPGRAHDTNIIVGGRVYFSDHQN